MDITLTRQDREPVDFEEFVADRLGLTARGVTVALEHHPRTSDWLVESVRDARRQWDVLGFDDAPEHFVFASTIALAGAAGNGSPQTIERAVAVARWSFGWSTTAIASTMAIETETVADIMERARSHFPLRDRNDRASAAERARAEVAAAVVELPDAAALAPVKPERKRRVVAVCGAVVLGVVVLAGALLGRSERAPLAELTPPSQDRTETAASEPATTTVRQALLALDEPETTGQEFSPRASDLIAPDGFGGFMAVQQPTNANWDIVFGQSSDGTVWDEVGRTTSRPDLAIQQFGRSGDSFFIITDNPADPAASIVGVSTDVQRWDWLDLRVEHTAPPGLEFATAISDVSISGDNVLALVSTTVEIDFAALSLSEGYTCGHKIDEGEVTVNMCNGSELDVLSVSRIDKLPARRQLFVSRDQRPFVPARVPFSDETVARLTNANGAFGITDQRGIPFATSVDGATWQTASAAEPPLEIRSSATDDQGAVAGLGAAGTELVLFGHQAGQTTITPLRDLIPNVRDDVSAVVSSGRGQWAIYLHDPLTNAWLLNSTDGITWNVAPASASGAITPQLLVGDDEAVVQWIDTYGVAVTLALPLD